MSYKNNKLPQHVANNSNIVPQSFTQKSYFDLSEGLLTTIGFDNLYPVMWEEMNPGDRFTVKISSLGRLMPMVSPPMSNMKLKYYAFFVPNRTMWDNWKKFQGAKEFLEEDPREHVVPQVALTPNATESGGIADYMGIPNIPDGGYEEVSALPFRAYNKIWNEWFRAHELQEPIRQVHGDDEDKTGLMEGDMGNDHAQPMYQLRKKGKPHDYFTSCLPFPQAGQPVMLPLTGSAPVIADTSVAGTSLSIRDRNNNNSGLIVNSQQKVVSGGTSDDPNTVELYANMSDVTGITVEQLRQAVALQQIMEKDAKAGQSYIDVMNIHFGVSIPDFLVGRSQFLGSTTSYINVEPIAQTGATASTPQGNLSGVGVQAQQDFLCECSAVEHGIFMILACAEGEVNYQQGIPRKFSKLARFDYMFPEFWNLGDQAVLNKEIFVTGDQAHNDATFGYQERYREYRSSFNKITGKMRSGIPGSLDVWHLAEKFNNPPTLNSEFIKSNTPISRVMAVPSEDQIILNVKFDIKAERNLPTVSNPSLLAGRV